MSGIEVPIEEGEEGEPAPSPDAATLRRARAWNLLGLASPAANLGMLLCAPRRLRWFGVGAGCVLAGGAAFAWSRGHERAAALLVAAHLSLVLLGLVDPRIPEGQARAWHALGRLLGGIGTRVLLVLAFFLVLTPIALLVRLLGNSPAPAGDAAAGSLWSPRRPSGRERMERQS